jgi:hypothetical protein
MENTEKLSVAEQAVIDAITWQIKSGRVGVESEVLIHLCKKGGSPADVQNAINSLVDRGLIVLHVVQYAGGRRKPVYRPTTLLEQISKIGQE